MRVPLLLCCVVTSALRQPSRTRSSALCAPSSSTRAASPPLRPGALLRGSAAAAAAAAALVGADAGSAFPAGAPPVRAAADASLTLSLSLKRSADSHDRAGGDDNNGGYFDAAHPEFAAALAVHWLLWGYAPRNVALAYDFGGVALLAAEGLLAR